MKNVIFVISLLNSMVGFGQNEFVLSGKINDAVGEPLLFGNVILFSKTDEKVIKYSYIENGKFTFDPHPSNEYVVEVQCLGYEQFQQDINLIEDIDLEITLKESTTVLEEVQVTAERNAIINKNGNLKMDVANTNFAAQPTTIALLSLFPKIIVEPNGTSLTVIGKGNPLLYLNNQRITMDELNSINVNAIQSIELINNPSAKYEAEGRAVILIKRKKGYGDGIQVTLAENASWQRNFNNYASANASLKRGRFELRSNFAYNQIGLWEGSDSGYQILANNTSAEESSFSSIDRPQFVVGGGLYFQLKEGDYISGNADLRMHTSVGPVISDASTFAENILIDKIDTYVGGDEERSFLSTNLNYNKSITSIQSNLFLGIQYSKYIRNVDSEVTNNYNDTQFETYEKRDQDFQIEAYAARIDFKKNITDNLKWEIGANLSIADADAFSEFDIFIPRDTNVISNYDYSEQNFAAYTQFSGTFQKVEYSIGLRSESNDVEGGFRGATQLTINRNRTIPFPKVMLNIPLDSSLNLTLNYAKTIGRPNYLNSSSISTYINPFLEYSRNVNLRPMINEEVSANFQYKRHSLELSYVRQQDPTFVSIRFDEATERLISSPQNLELQTSWNLALTMPFIYKKWTATNFIRCTISKMQDASAIEQGVAPSLYIYTRHQLGFGKGFSLGGTLWGLTDRKMGIIDQKGFVILDLYVSKLFGKKLTIALGLNDLFQNFEFGSTYNYNNVLTNEVRFGDRKAFAVNVRYSFGEKFKSKYQNKDIDDNLGRMR